MKRASSRSKRATKKRSGKGAKKRTQRTLSAAWQEWVAQNILRGVPRSAIVERLRAERVPDATIVRELAVIEASPILAAARPFARDARRHAMGTRLMRMLARAASDPVSVPRRSGVSAAELRDVFVAAGQPVILTDVASKWPAWTPRELADRFGDVVVDVTTDRDSDPNYDENAEKHQTPMPLRDLVERMERASEPTNDFYLIARARVLARTALRALLDEITMPDGYLVADGVERGAALWLGPAGTVTPLHHDTSNILFAQIHGKKRWRLVAPYETSLLEDARSLYAGRDPEKDDFGDVIVKDVVLAPGEMLFVPVGFWHHVRALDASISIAFNSLAFANDFEWFRPGQVR